MTSPHAAPERTPGWLQVKEILRERTPQAIVIDGEPSIQLVVDGEHQTMILRCEASTDLSPEDFERLAELEVSRSQDGIWLEVRTNAPDLFPFFVAFSATVADDVQLEGTAIGPALARSLRLFRRLVRDSSLLSPERQLGLLGELWVLERLLQAWGKRAFEAWLGPNAESHDFRWGAVELEVKTTRRQQRHHIINGLDQLDASPGADLFIVSLQLAAAGPPDTGWSLSSAIASVRSRLSNYDLDATFDSVLVTRFDLTPETEHRYADQLKLRTPPQLIPIIEGSARLTRSDVLAVPHDEMHRVVDCDYVLDCEGLGWPDGSPEFLEIIPR